MTHEQWTDAAAGYALGVLDADDLAAFEAHLPECAACRAEVDSFRATAGLLAFGAPLVHTADPAALRARVLARATQVLPIASTRSIRPRAEWPGWAAAAACLVLAAGAGRAWQQQRARTIESERQLAAANSALAERAALLDALHGPEVHVVSLAPAGEKPALRVYWNHTKKLFIVTAFRLPPPPEGKTYQLWAVQNGKAPASMGTFASDANGQATTIIQVSASITDAGFIDNCALTLEPAGGSAQPTETPRLIGPWRHVD